MTTNEGVGKKIVEALKKQAATDFDITDDVETSIEPSFIYADEKADDTKELKEEVNLNSVEDKFEIKEEPIIEKSFEGEQKEFVFEQPEVKQETFIPQTQEWHFEEKQEFQPVFQEEKINIQNSTRQFDMPANVAVLKKLITQLPTGVTKQTGAQIIKQTMEALGISMNSVLHDAQKVQDEMNDSIKNCMMSIQEYKNNIRNLEKQGLDYQRQVNQLNDLISLFILSDKD